MKFARVQDGVVLEVVEAADIATLRKMFHPNLVATFVAGPDDVAPGYLYDGKAFSVPPVEVPPEPDYRAQRAAALIKELSPEGTFEASVGDCLDALVKQVESIRQFLVVKPVEEYVEKLTIIAEIKDRYPPPDES